MSTDSILAIEGSRALPFLAEFLKHADEVQDDEEMLEVHRMIFDFIRAAEPSYQRKDPKEYLHRVRGKLPKLRRAAEYFAGQYSEVSSHTNFQMAALSLSGCVQHITEILDHVLGAARQLGASDVHLNAGLPPVFRIKGDLRTLRDTPPLTAEVKAKIFGLNAARLYGIDPSAKRNPIPGDYVEWLRKNYQESGPTPSNTQYGWVLA